MKRTTVFWALWLTLILTSLHAQSDERDAVSATAAQLAAGTLTYVHADRLGQISSTHEFSLTFDGAPASTSVSITPCVGFASTSPPTGTCKTATTSTATGTQLIPVTGIADFYIVTVSWTGAPTGVRIAIVGTHSASGGGSGSFTLTTLGTSGASTYTGGILNIPAYAASSSGGIAAPPGFPQQLLGWTGPTTIFPLDGKSYDAAGIGGPSNTIFINGEYWVAASGYPSSGFTAQAVGFWHSPSLAGPWTAYTGNPVVSNTYPAWAAACVEGPMFNQDTAGNVYLSFLGFSSGCDSEGPGTIGIISTTAANFPTGWSALPAAATIPKPAALNWLYRPDIIEIGGICYDYSNVGDTSNNPSIGYFTTNGPCATTETAGPWTYQGIAFGHSQAWEGPSNYELQDPQVFRDPSGLYVMLYGGGGLLTAGYATTLTPAANNWVKQSTNPFQAGNANYSTGVGSFWLPRITMDSAGQYWMMANYNGTAGMSLWKGTGPAQSHNMQYISNGQPVTAANPTWSFGEDASGNFVFYKQTLAATALYGGYYTPPTAVLALNPNSAGLGCSLPGTPVLTASGSTAGSGASIIFESGRPLTNCNFSVDVTPGGGATAGLMFAVVFTDATGTTTPEPAWTCTITSENGTAASTLPYGALGGSPVNSAIGVSVVNVPSSIVGYTMKCGATGG